MTANNKTVRRPSGGESEQSDTKRTGPVWRKRYWTGGGSVEVAIFEHVIDNGQSSFTSYATSISRNYKDGDQYKSARSFRLEDLLPLSHGLAEAFTWISSQQK